MSRGPSLMNAPITLADLILAGMAAFVVWHYARGWLSEPEPRRALTAVPSAEPLPEWLRGPGTERVEELVRADGRAAHTAARTTRGRSPRSEAQPSD